MKAARTLTARDVGVEKHHRVIGVEGHRTIGLEISTDKTLQGTIFLHLRKLSSDCVAGVLAEEQRNVTMKNENWQRLDRERREKRDRDRGERGGGGGREEEERESKSNNAREGEEGSRRVKSGRGGKGGEKPFTQSLTW